MTAISLGADEGFTSSVRSNRSRGGDQPGKLIGFQARLTHERAVDVLLGGDRGGVLRTHAAAVQQRHPAGQVDAVHIGEMSPELVPVALLAASLQPDAATALAVMMAAVGLYNAGQDWRMVPVAGIAFLASIGAVLYRDYLFLFEAAGIVLLVAMIGAIVLTHRARGGVRPQNIARQNQRRPQDAVRNVNQPVGQGVEL